MISSDAYSEASANNGSGFEGLADTYGFNDNPNPAPYAPHWDIATGLVMLIVMLGAIFIGIQISFTLLFLAMTFGYFALGKVVFDLDYFQTDPPGSTTGNASPNGSRPASGSRW